MLVRPLGGTRRPPLVEMRDAQHNLALLKRHGTGVKRDRATALKLMDRALSDPADYRAAIWSVAMHIATWVLAAVTALMLLRLAWSRL
jgi:TPR repeat protein